jgi:hypothetical protein
MKLFDQYRRQGEPDTYTFVFDQTNETGDYPMLSMPDDGRWPYSP